MISHQYIHGGLGNQMFQYAAAFAHARKMGVDLFYPIKPSLPNTNACLNLYDVFNLSGKKTGSFGPEYREPSFAYSPIPELKSMTLNGYYQSEKYFDKYKEEIKKEFTFKKPTQRKVLKDTVSIHVRRGDYVEQTQYHPLCGLDYYSTAMKEFEGCEFLVFSDDKEWCLQHFDYPNAEVFLSNSAEEDLQVMSMCDHHIIANSSFSWWGAWLSINKNKRVIAPKNWFGQGYSSNDTSDLYLPEWTLI